MGKLIRPTYPPVFSFGLLILIFLLSCFLSHQVFNVPFSKSESVYLGMILVGIAVIIMILILWEEFLFPIKVKEVNGEIIFRNHRTKLKAQILMYCFIPAIFVFIYFEYDVNHFRFFIWAAVCIGAPIVEKLTSGINNYNDFLKLSHREIKYKNNEKEGRFAIKDIKNITIITAKKEVRHKIQLLFASNAIVVIDLDEMELEVFYDSIYKYITVHYKHLLTETNAAT
jgi:hypothetical protein